MPAELLTTILDQAERVRHAGFKAFGLLLAEPTAPRHPYHPSDVVFLNPQTNHRNDPDLRDAFQAQSKASGQRRRVQRDNDSLDEFLEEAGIIGHFL